MSLKRGWGDDMGEEEVSASLGTPTCPVCSASFSFHSQLRRHVRYEHPHFDTRALDGVWTSLQCASGQTEDELMENVNTDNSSVSGGTLNLLNLICSWCDIELDEKEVYDQHIEDHKTESYKEYLKAVDIFAKEKTDKENYDVQVHGQNLTPSDMIDENRRSSTCNSIVKGAHTDMSSMNNKTVISVEGKSHGSESKLSTQNIINKEDIDNNYCCNKIHHSKVSLENHMDTCHPESVRCCVLCNEMCQNAESYRCHIVYHYKGVRTCPVCPIKFNLRSQVLSHLNCCHSNGYVIICEKCKSEFTDYNDYEGHVAQEHGQGAICKCKICLKEILAFQFNEHLQVHVDSPSTNSIARPHACTMCSAKFIFSTQLYHHKYYEHRDAFIYNCDECERRFRSERTLLKHKWGHKYGSHRCPVCRLKFRQVDQLKRHLLSVHPEHEGYNCKFCSAVLKNYATYVAHLKFKHPKEAGYNKRPVRCKICGESFDHKVQWKYHMRMHNRSAQTCNICGVHVKNLEVHMNLHTRVKKFECSECGAVYHNKASFHFHVKRVHMGMKVRKHECEICGKNFLTPADLRIHTSRVHHGERNFWCEICCKGYKSKVSLTYHQRLHTGERPHQCTICKRSFRIPSYLKRHMEHDHQVSYPGVYFKKGRPQNQNNDKHMIRYNSQQHIPESTGDGAATEEIDTSLPEIVQITVPTEVGGEIVSAVQSAQDISQEQQHLQLEHFEHEGVVYVVYEN